MRHIGGFQESLQHESSLIWFLEVWILLEKFHSNYEVLN